MKRLAPTVFVVALLGALAFWWFSPVQVVKRRTATLLEVLTLEPGSGRSGRQLGAYSLNALLAREIELKSGSISEANGTFDRSELESAYSWLCGQAEQSGFTLERFHSVVVEGDQATVECSITALVELPNDRPADGTYEVTFRWIREEDAWRLAGATWAGP